MLQVGHRSSGCPVNVARLATSKVSVNTKKLYVWKTATLFSGEHPRVISGLLVLFLLVGPIVFFARASCVIFPVLFAFLARLFVFFCIGLFVFSLFVVSAFRYSFFLR